LNWPSLAYFGWPLTNALDMAGDPRMIGALLVLRGDPKCSDLIPILDLEIQELEKSTYGRRKKEANQSAQ